MTQCDILVEIGQNHNGDMALARRLIDEVADAGATAAKFQVYDARALFPREGNPWFDYNCKTELSRADVEMLAEHCRARGVEFLASVFDVERVDWLEQVGVKRYKLASRSIADKALIERLAATGKPLIVSLGHWREQTFPAIPARDVSFLHCISKYPTAHEELKLGSVDFTRYAGFSDHTVGIEACMVALSRGARILEKHFTLDTSLYGPDHACSMTPDELRRLIAFRNVAVACL